MGRHRYFSPYLPRTGEINGARHEGRMCFPLRVGVSLTIIRDEMILPFFSLSMCFPPLSWLVSHERVVKRKIYWANCWMSATHDSWCWKVQCHLVMAYLRGASGWKRSSDTLEKKGMSQMSSSSSTSAGAHYCRLHYFCCRHFYFPPSVRFKNTIGQWSWFTNSLHIYTLLFDSKVVPVDAIRHSNHLFLFPDIVEIGSWRLIGNVPVIH